MAEMPAPNSPPTLRKRRLLIGTNVLVQIIFVLSLVVAANWLASRHYHRFDLTKSQYYKLSDKTKQVLTHLKEPVKVIVFLPPTAGGETAQKLLGDVRNLLKEFQYYGQAKLPVEFVDPQRDLDHAKQLVDEYKLDPSSPDVVIFRCGDRHKYVTIDEMIVQEFNPMSQGARVKGFKGEGAFLSAIESVTSTEQPKVYFLSGAGERDPDSADERQGYSALAAYIKRDNLSVAKWNLLEKQSLPTDAGAIIIAGPTKPFTDPELAALDQYLKNKGRLLILLDPRKQTGLERFLQGWGVQVDNDRVMGIGSFGGLSVPLEPLGTKYAPHPITSKLEGVNTTFPYARSLRPLPRTEAPGADQPRVTELVKTPEGFWGGTDFEAEEVAFDPKRDLRGPMTLAVAVEAGKPTGVDVDIPTSRLVVVGSSSFVDNRSLAAGNLDFFMNALNWLLKRDQLVAVGPKTLEEFHLDMTMNQTQAVYALVVVGLPLAVALLGFAVWARRRK